MPPLTDAVRFVDGEQGNIQITQTLLEGVAHQALRGDVEQAQFTRMQTRKNAARLLGTLRGIVKGGLHAIGLQGIHLILHQGNQR